MRTRMITIANISFSYWLWFCDWYISKRKPHSPRHTIVYTLLKLDLWTITEHRDKRTNMIVLLNILKTSCQKLKVQSLVLLSQIINQTTCFCLDMLFDCGCIRDFITKKIHEEKLFYCIVATMLPFNHANIHMNNIAVLCKLWHLWQYIGHL